MKKTSKLLGLVAMLFITTTSFSQDVEWYSWKDGYAKAKKENKIIILDAYTEWCGWCKVMDKKTYTDNDVQKKIASDFVAIKLNPELTGSYKFNGVAYNGKQLIAKLSANKFRGYPTTFFINSKTNKSNMEVGFIKAKPFSDLLDKYKN